MPNNRPRKKKRADPRDACPKPFALVFQLWHPAKISHRVKHHAGQTNHSQSNRQGTFLPSIQSLSRILHRSPNLTKIFFQDGRRQEARPHRQEAYVFDPIRIRALLPRYGRRSSCLPSILKFRLPSKTTRPTSEKFLDKDEFEAQLEIGRTKADWRRRPSPPLIILDAGTSMLDV